MSCFNTHIMTSDALPRMYWALALNNLKENLMFKTIADIFAMASLFINGTKGYIGAYAAIGTVAESAANVALTKTQVWETEQQMQLTDARNRLHAMGAPTLLS